MKYTTYKYIGYNRGVYTFQYNNMHCIELNSIDLCSNLINGDELAKRLDTARDKGYKFIIGEYYLYDTYEVHHIDGEFFLYDNKEKEYKARKYDRKFQIPNTYNGKKVMKEPKYKLMNIVKG